VQHSRSATPVSIRGTAVNGRTHRPCRVMIEMSVARRA